MTRNEKDSLYAISPRGIFPAVVALALLAAACTEFLEESIADGKVELLSPGVDAETNRYTVDFLWEPLEHAFEYRLQVASPGFGSGAIIVADTVLERPRFSTSLEPGVYQWRVQARNGSSRTDHSLRAFTIHEASLANQAVLLSAPADDHVTARPRVELAWQRLFGATAYRIQVDTEGFADGRDASFEQVVAEETAVYQLEEEATYRWRVRAEKGEEHARWSAVRGFTYDRTPPPVPTPASPANNAQVNRPVTLQWNASAGATGYRLYVYKADSTLFSDQYPRQVEGTSQSVDTGTRGERILWRVRAVDRAGNESDYSAWRSFSLRN